MEGGRTFFARSVQIDGFEEVVHCLKPLSGWHDYMLSCCLLEMYAVVFGFNHGVKTLVCALGVEHLSLVSSDVERHAIFSCIIQN